MQSAHLSPEPLMFTRKLLLLCAFVCVYIHKCLISIILLLCTYLWPLRARSVSHEYLVGRMTYLPQLRIIT